MHSVRFENGEIFKPSKIIGVGRNYAEHIKEMESKPTRSPVLFIKPNSALCDISEPLHIPNNFGEVHYELELAVLIGKQGSDIAQEDAADFIAGYGLALDLTLREVQSAAKNAGLPWATAKGFDGSCPVSDFVIPKNGINAGRLALKLSVNGQVRQEGNTNQMIFPVAKLIESISGFFTLYEGDLILTGTPAGVGPLHSGDQIEASIESVAHIKTSVV